jgi:CBS domain-containing protein
MICPTCNFDNLPGSEQCYYCLHDLTQLDSPTAHDRVERSLMDDRVSALRPRPAVTLAPEATVGEAMRTMLSNNIGALPVVDDAGHLLGVFSERDLLTKVALTGPGYAGRPVRDFMTRNPETVREGDTLAFVLHKMDSGGYRHLPVLREGRVLGMISVRDMLRHITRLCKGVCS